MRRLHPLAVLSIAVSIAMSGCGASDPAAPTDAVRSSSPAPTPATSTGRAASSPPATPTPSSAALLAVRSGTPSTVVSRFRVGGTPCGVVGAKGFLWVTDPGLSRLIKLDPRSGKITATYRVETAACELIVADGVLWIVTQTGVLHRLDLRSGKLTSIRVGLTSYEPLAAFGAIWVSNRGTRDLSKVDPRTGRVVATLPLPDIQPGGLTAANGSLWIGNDTAGDRQLVRVNPVTLAVTTVTAGRRPAFVAAAGGSVWVANQDDGTVSRLDAATGRLVATLPAGTRPVNLGPLPGRHPEVWVPDDQGNTVTRIDATTGRVVERLAGGAGPAVVAAVGGDVWVTNFEDGTVWRIRPGRR